MRLKIFLFINLIVCVMNAQNSDYLKMIEAAIKAPSGHNSQPWLFQLKDSAINILPNMEEILPVVDKSNRELFISLGAAAENLCIEASALGYNSNVEIDEINQKIVVHLCRNSKIIADSLCKSIVNRQTNRKLYNNKIVSDDIILHLDSLPLSEGISRYIISKNDSLFNILKSYIEKGNQIQMNDKAFKDELLRYMRFNNAEVKKHPTGLTYKTMGAPAMPSFISKFIVKSYLNPNKQNKGDLKKIESSSHLVLFTTKNNTLTEWVNLGRNLQRFLLITTQLNIANAYMNQPCEIDKLACEIQECVSRIKGEYPTLLLRIGYGESIPFSPRKKITDVI